ncbi:hypothetical protein PUNSTDRAFT_141611 [Punctularia strigosozonata HHB-11173 SS5]|uniref:uncharacterized protein n=1 Tax=Punctularia strigosozonata (strain HHB-11173) TaxID=741275 RepID=UPI0004416B73|nr:uncharacterized protein PUNSTDRAFT_141611 [Punctularia strigosozonata HHB-11173 SS5]EIN11153.1 hypothetical protein PUNSTDRAFT_141611 [Punctularia strigosozonata HHB-11173 SS5]
MASVSAEEWESKLKGKKIVDAPGNTSGFSKQDLPHEHRVIAPGSAITMDWRPSRLNVHVDEDGFCTHCTSG